MRSFPPVLALLLAGCAREVPAPTTPAAVASLVFAKGRVDVEGGIIKLAASRDGLVKEVAVEEGACVRAGQVLALIDDQSARLALAIAQAELAQARAALPGIELRLAAANREAARWEPLVAAAAASTHALDQARDQAAFLRTELAAASAAVAISAARLRSSEYEVEQRIVRAPLDGWIVKRFARPGDGVSTVNVTPLFHFAPDSPRIVRADLDEHFVDRVQTGLAAEVLLEADERRVIPAKVLRVGQVFGTRISTGEPGEKVDQRVVECVVSVADQTLRIGQRVLVRITP